MLLTVAVCAAAPVTIRSGVIVEKFPLISTRPFPQEYVPSEIEGLEAVVSPIKTALSVIVALDEGGVAPATDKSARGNVLLIGPGAPVNIVATTLFSVSRHQ